MLFLSVDCVCMYRLAVIVIVARSCDLMLHVKFVCLTVFLYGVCCFCCFCLLCLFVVFVMLVCLVVAVMRLMFNVCCVVLFRGSYKRLYFWWFL